MRIFLSKQLRIILGKDWNKPIFLYWFSSPCNIQVELTSFNLFFNPSSISGTRINPNSDLKISFTFDRNKLSVPWVTVFDSKNRVTLKKMIVTFTHNEFELVRVDFKPLCTCVWMHIYMNLITISTMYVRTYVLIEWCMYVCMCMYYVSYLFVMPCEMLIIQRIWKTINVHTGFILTINVHTVHERMNKCMYCTYVKLYWTFYLSAYLHVWMCIDGKKITRLDPSHPALRGFEMEYRWESVQEEDFDLGVATLFLSAVLGFFLIFFLTVCRCCFLVCMYVCMYVWI